MIFQSSLLSTVMFFLSSSVLSSQHTREALKEFFLCKTSRALGRAALAAGGVRVQGRRQGPVVEERKPVDEVEAEEEEQEEDVQPGVGRFLSLLLALADVDGSLVVHLLERALLPLRLERLGRLELHLEQESGVLDEGAEDEEYAHDDPRLDCRQALRLRNVAAQEKNGCDISLKVKLQLFYA